MGKRSLMQKSWIFAFILAIVLFVVFHQNVHVRMFLPEYYQCKYQFRQNLTSAMNDYRRCLLKMLRPHKDMFKHVHVAVDQCVDKELWKKFDIKYYHNGEEPKMVMLAKPGQPCVEVTLGVGNNINAEQQLKKAVPQCQLFGADPILASGRVFRDVGQYFQIAVGANAGVLTHNVLENGRYQEKNVSTVDFVEFLKEYVNSSSVDIMLMDNEGPEYEIFPKYLIDSPPLVRICQLNVEMHDPLEKYGMNANMFNELMESILTKSQFVPFSSSTSGHLRMFYVNVDDSACVDKFFLYKFCDRSSGILKG